MSGVVVHLAEGDPDRQLAVLRNVMNLRADLGALVSIELVAHGSGVELMTGESGLADGVAQLTALGVTRLACRNTLASRGLTPEDLLPGVGVVPSGVGQLVRRQLEGWAYVRP